MSSAEDRLRYYAQQFPIVEVDSTYYAPPTARNSELWAARTPEGIAVTCGGRPVTYAWLDATSNRWARHLIALGGDADMLVGIAMGVALIMVQVKSPMLVAVGMYLPLQTSFAIFVGGSVCWLRDQLTARRGLNDAQKARVGNAGVLVAAGLTARQTLHLHLHVLEELIHGLGSRSTRHVMNRAD